MELMCPHNREVICDNGKCYSCGWDPRVAKERLKEFMGGTERYRVPFTGYCKVWADSPEDALEKASTGKIISVHYDYETPTSK